MDDPIFDPWAIGGQVPVEPSSPGVDPDAADTDETVPRAANVVDAEPVDAAPTVKTDAPGPRRWVVPAPSRPPAPSPLPAAPPPPSVAALSALEPHTSDAPSQRPRARGEDQAPRPRPQPLHLRALQVVARPRLEELRARLEVAGHQAILDDRSDREVPSLRLRFIPRLGAFDEPTADGGAVLEVTWDDDSAHVTARLWLDPMAEEWAQQVTAPPARADVAWVDRVILEFLSKTLRA